MLASIPSKERHSEVLRFMKKQIEASSLYVAIFALAASLAGAGCSTSGWVAGQSINEPSPYLLVNNRTIASQVDIIDVDYDNVGGFIRANVTIVSRRHRSLAIEYRFNWYDGSGRELEPGKKPYKTIILDGMDSMSLQSVAPLPEAREFKINIKKIKAIRIKNVR
jgi:uncharacterized protein YcfL